MPAPSPGLFITLEGLDGSGKSTQLEKLAAWFQQRQRQVVITREPGGTPIGDQIRALLLDSATSGMDPLTELALMFASRAQHIAQVIRPALDGGAIVLCDRFTDSTEAYQGGGRRLGSEPVLALHKVLCGDLQPDVTLLLDCDPIHSLNRARRRNRESLEADENRFEQENRAFFARVAQAYQEIARRNPQRVKVIDARGTPEQTHREIVRVVQERMKKS